MLIYKCSTPEAMQNYFDGTKTECKCRDGVWITILKHEYKLNQPARKLAVVASAEDLYVKYCNAMNFSKVIRQQISDRTCEP